MEADEARRLTARADQLRTVMALAEQAVEQGRPADEFLTGEFRRHRAWGSRDRRLISRLVFAAFRWRGWLGRYAEHGDRVLIGAHLLESAERHPVIDRMIRETGADPDAVPPWSGDALEARAERVAGWLGFTPRWEQLVPDWVLEVLAAPAGVDRERLLYRCVESFQVRPPLWLRAVGLSEKQLAEKLAAFGLTAQPAERPPYAVRVEGQRPHLPTLDRALGPCFEVQDLASQCVGWAAGVGAGDHWWDVCAGAGGKALHLAAAGARVLATDVRAAALAEARRRTQRLGLQEIEIARHDGTQPLTPAARFDGVLVDAPCSGLGMWARRPDARWQITPQTIRSCADLQGRLLDNAARHVRPGGRLVYSVCTMTSAETIEVVRRFEERHPTFEAEAMEHPLQPGVSAHPLWIWPWDGPCGGMFIARWRNRADE